MTMTTSAASAMAMIAALGATAAHAQTAETTLAQLSPRLPSVGSPAPAGAIRSSDEPPGNAVPRTPQSNSLRSSPEGLSPRPGDNTTGDQSLQLQEPPVPTSPPPRVGLFPGFGQTLLDHGVDFHGVAFDRFFANPSAGVITGQTANLGAFRPAVDLDLQKILGVPGGTIHASMTFFGLRSDLPQVITQAGGFQTGFQTLPASQTNILSLLTYEQRLLGDRLSIEAGRTNVYNYFQLPNSLDPFTYFSPTFQVTADLPSPPYPNWGGRITYKLTPTWYVQGGAFDDNYKVAATNGNRFGTSLSNGAQLIAEVGQRSEFSNDPYPTNLEVGADYNTRFGRTNLKGTGAPANTLLQPSNYPGGGVVYIQGLKVLWRGANKDVGPPSNIAVFGALNASLDKPQPFDMDALLGVNFTGFIPGRPFDALGLQTRYTRLSQDEANAETRRQRLLVRGNRNGPDQPRDGYSFEAIYNVQITPSISFRPYAEYFINPDNYYPPATPDARPRSGWEAGFFATVALGRFLGTSLKPN